MASSSSLCNFLSFISSPTKPLSPKSPPQLHLLPQIRRRSEKWVPLVANAVGPSSSSSSSDDSLSSMAIVCPSLAYANTLFFKSAYNVQVIVDDNEPEEKLLGRFRREVMRAGVIQECKRRRFFENKQDEKKRRTREAAKRNKRRRPQWRSAMQNKEEASTAAKKKADEEEDNWELPEGDLPN